MIRRVLLLLFATCAVCFSPGFGFAQSDSLIVRDGFGDPGSTGNILSIDLKNSVGVGKIQFTLSFDSDLLNVTNVLPTGRSGDMSTFNWNESVPGQVTVFVLDLDGDTIESGSGSIADFAVDVAPGVHYQEIPMLLSGVGVHDANSQMVPTTALNGQFIVTEPDIYIPAASRDFGQIIVGNSSTWKATITNVGTKDLTINYITSSSGEFTVQMLMYPQVLAPDSSLNVDLTFTPAMAGVKSSSMYIVSDDPDENVATIGLAGFGIAPDISVSAGSHNFGSVMGYSTETWVMTISNVGSTASLTVTNITSNHTDFRISSPTFPRVVPVDGSLNVSVAFSPKRLGSIAGVLTISSNDPDEKSVPIQLNGIGYYPEATMTVVGGSGAEDSHDNVVPVSLSNGMSIGFLQFRFNYPPSVLSVSGVRPTGRASLMSFFNWSETTPGIVDVLIADISGSVITAGTEPLVEFLVDVDPGAVLGEAQLVLSDVVLTDISSNPIPVRISNGTFLIISAPDIDLSAYNLQFGHVMVGDSLGRPLWLHNRGSGQLTVQSIAATPGSFRPQFPPFPQVVGPGDSLAGMLFFKPVGLGPVSGTFTVRSNDPNEAELSAALGGTGVLPDIALSSSSIQFGDVWVTDTSTVVLTISNAGSAALTIQSLFVAPIQFEVSSDPLPATVPVGGSVQAVVSFHPTTTGLRSGSLTVQCNDPDETTVIVALSGTGIDPEIELSKTSHAFGNVLVGEFRNWNLMIRNRGLTPLQIDSIRTSHADYTIIGMTLPRQLPPRDSVQATVRFRPAAVGDRAGVVSIFSNDRDESPADVPVSGKGVIPDIHLSTATHDFGDVFVQDTSRWTLQIHNYDIGPLLVASITTNNSDFSVAGVSFPDTVAFGDSLSVPVVCVPSKTGPISGILRITSNDPDEAQMSVSLGVNGVVSDIVLSATNHYFGLGVLCDTVLWEFTIHNHGTAGLAISSVFADTVAYRVVAPVFPQVVGPRDSMTVSVGFAPLALGSTIGKLYIAANDPDEPLLSMALSGIGVAPDLAVSSLTHDFGPVPVGYSGEWTVTVSNQGTWNLVIDSAYTSSAVYSVVSPAFPLTILPTKQIQFVVSFSPVADGRSAASLTLLNNDCDEGVLNVMLSGTGYSVQVAMPDTSAAPDRTISVPVMVDNLTGLDIYSWETRVSFDPAFLTAVRATSQGSISQKWGSPVYSIAPGSIDIEMSGINALAGSGPLVFITFLVDEGLSSGDSTLLNFESFRFNDGAPASQPTFGSFHVNRPPQIDPIPDLTAHEGLAFDFTVTASDADRDNLVFSAANLPAGSSFDPATQTFQWSPPFGSAGSYPGLKFYVSDGQFADTASVTLTVESSVRVMVPDTTRPAGITFGLPIVLLDAVATEDSIYSMDLILTYDPEILTAMDATIAGTLTAGWGPLAYRVTDGQISFGIVGFSPLQGSGVLVYINFVTSTRVSPGDSSLITLSDFQFNDGDPSASMIPGVLRIPLYFIAGSLTYYMTHSPGNPIDNVLMQVIGSESITDVSDSEGDYLFPNLVGGLGYAIQPAKDGDWREAIQSFDASLITRHVVGLETLNDYQRTAADVTGNGTVSPLDASQILQFRVGIIDEFSVGKDWKFVPGRRDYPRLDANYADEDYVGILYGDVSGNWGETMGAKTNVGAAEWIRIPELDGGPGQNLSLPISLQISGSVLSADIDISYDPESIGMIGVARTELTSDCLLEYIIADGHVRIALANTVPFQKHGELIRLLCRVSPLMSAGDVSALQYTIRLNETLLPGMTSTITAARPLPTEYGLSQNYPNPFNPTTSIQFAVGSGQSAAHVTLKIFNVMGQEVATLVDGLQEPGYYTATWDASAVTSGVYFYRLDTDGCRITKKMMLVK